MTQTGQSVWLAGALAVLISCGGGGEADPLAVIVDKIAEPMGWDPAGTRIYVVDQPLQPGQTVAPALGPDGDAGEVTTIDRPTWFAWVDMSPDEYFSHPTRFIYMDADGGNVRMEDHDWFPVVDGRTFFPEEPDWGDDAAAAARLVPREPARPAASYTSPHTDDCGQKAFAIVMTGFSGKRGWLNVTANRALAALRARPYEQVYDLRASVTPDNLERKRALFEDILPALAARDDVYQIDFFYLGHGAAGVWLLGGDNEEWTPAIAVEDIAARLEGTTAAQINVSVDSCHAALWANDLDAKTSPSFDGANVRVLAASGANQEAIYGEAGSSFTEEVLVQLEGQPEDRAFDYAAVAVPRIEYQVTTPSGLANKAQDPESFVAPPEDPLLFLGDEANECQVVGVLPNAWPDGYERRVTVRGAGFGDARGTVHLHEWDLGSFDDFGAWAVGLAHQPEIVLWSETAITFRVPMGSRGFPGDPEGLDAVVAGENYPAVLSAFDHQIGRYYVQVETADGRRSPDYRDGWTLRREEYRPQLVHVWPQVLQADWTPDYSNMTSVDWNEMWHPMAPASMFLGAPTVLVSDMRLVSEMDEMGNTIDWAPYPYMVRDDSSAHTTGTQAQALGGWTYELAADLRDLATANDQRNPDITYWGFRQLFDDGWAETPTWRFTLAYD